MVAQAALSIVVANLWINCLSNVLSLWTTVKRGRRGPGISLLCWDFCPAVFTQLLFKSCSPSFRSYLNISAWATLGYTLESFSVENSVERCYLKLACWWCQTVLTAALPQDLLLCLFLSSVTLDQMSTSSGPVSGVFLSLKWFLEQRGVCSWLFMQVWL